MFVHHSCAEVQKMRRLPGRERAGRSRSLRSTQSVLPQPGTESDSDS